ncbi:DHS-like NAD/FAD-binding domain-containing protein [Microthyrium microscopicum]|uniref:DHS-like NAD/FAD-binding domain-containing protein n=1 Tax=Microthyrium microscopicum TaxID=703497 RepID=A0A6A6UBQ3_9PEZI|nr:DHS-like NAD/FAD-binding domain-containing protein [Microthyrium microscopicum]
MPSIRIPYTSPFPVPRVIPPSAQELPGAIAALTEFLTSAKTTGSKRGTVCLTGAGISVASGLNDYRGIAGAYIVNKSFRPIYYNEFLDGHAFRKRYWARSYVGWPGLRAKGPNSVHHLIKRLGELEIFRSVITQNVDSFHQIHPSLPTVELHGFLRSAICITCGTYHPRDEFQDQLSALNPAWADFVNQMIASGAISTEDPTIQKDRGLRTNPDGDIDIPGASYSTFRYPACPTCLRKPPTLPNGQQGRIDIDQDGAWLESSDAGILKPAVVMFGEGIKTEVKDAAEAAIDGADRVLVIGSSLATYSAWRLAKRAVDMGMPLGILNLGGTRGEEAFFERISGEGKERTSVRINLDAAEVLPPVVKAIESQRSGKN